MTPRNLFVLVVVYSPVMRGSVNKLFYLGVKLILGVQDSEVVGESLRRFGCLQNTPVSFYISFLLFDIKVYQVREV